MSTRTPKTIHTYSRRNRHYPRLPSVAQKAASGTQAETKQLERDLVVLRDRVGKIENVRTRISPAHISSNVSADVTQNAKMAAKLLSVIQVAPVPFQSTF